MNQNNYLILELLYFWKWFFHGISELTPGYRRILNKFLFMHFIFGMFIAWIVPISSLEAAEKILFPLSGILIGVSCAWSGTIQAMIRSENIQHIERFKAGGVFEYSFCYLLALFISIMTICFWGLAGIGFFSSLGLRLGSYEYAEKVSIIFRALLYGLTSLSIRNTWQIMKMVHQMYVLDFFVFLKNHFYFFLNFF